MSELIMIVSVLCALLGAVAGVYGAMADHVDMSYMWDGTLDVDDE